MKYILALIVAVSLTACGKSDGSPSKIMKSINLETALRYSKDANMAIKAGDLTTACVYYGIAKHAALQSGEEESYKIVRETEIKVCKAAGMNV